jgi:hypothetical protein
VKRAAGNFSRSPACGCKEEGGRLGAGLRRWELTALLPLFPSLARPHRRLGVVAGGWVLRNNRARTMDPRWRPWAWGGATSTWRWVLVLQSALFSRVGGEGAAGMGMVRRSPRWTSRIRFEDCCCSSLRCSSHLPSPVLTSSGLVGAVGCGIWTRENPWPMVVAMTSTTPTAPFSFFKVTSRLYPVPHCSIYLG